MSQVRVSCYPNAGLPNDEGKYLETPQTLASAAAERFIENGWINIVGGCCGTTDAHIKAIAQMAEGKKPRALPANQHRAYYSGIELVEAEDSVRPLIVPASGPTSSAPASSRTWWRMRNGKRPPKSRAGKSRMERTPVTRLPAKHGSRRNSGYSPLLRKVDA